MLRFKSPPSSASQKVPVNEPTPGSPTGAPMERAARFQSLLLHVSRVSHKSSPDKRNFTLLSKALGKERPPMFPKKGPLWKQTPISRFLSQSSHRETDAPFQEPSFIHLYKSLVNEPPSRFRSWAPMERDARHRPRSPMRTEGLHTTECGLVP
jgi:hypothetical protein